MKFFEVGNPVIALVCAKDEQECLEVYLQKLEGTAHKPKRLTECYEIRFGQILRETSDLINEETKKPFGLNEASNQIFISVFQRKPIVFWKTTL